MLNLFQITDLINSAKKWGRMLALLFCVWLLTWVGAAAPIKRGLNSWLQPVMAFNVGVIQQVIVPVNNLRRAIRAARKVQHLETQLAQAEAQLSRLQQLEEENQALKAIIENTDRDLSPSYISRPILSLSQPAVALPKDRQFSLPAAVLIDQTLVGVAEEKEDGIAYINLLWQQRTSPILAETESGVEGLARGDGRRVLLTEIPMDEEIVVGERVVAVGQRGIESGIHIGQIQSIESGDSSAVKQAVVEQYVSFYESRVVELR